MPADGAGTSGGGDGSGSANDSSVGAPPQPPTTCSEAVKQARNALRVFREHLREGSNSSDGAAASAPGSGSSSSGNGMAGPRLVIELPLPVRRGVGAFDRGGVPDDTLRMLDESDWPGGMQQRFRALRPLIDRLLEGYNADFLGMLESPSDGLGVWSAENVTVSGIVTNATVPSFLKLASGGYGRRVLEPGHAMVAVNPMWTSGDDVGQLWERGLKERARDLLDAPWESLYVARVVRGARSGACGLLLRAYPHAWQLYACEDADDLSKGVGPRLLQSAERPSSEAVAAALSEHSSKKKREGGPRGFLSQFK